MNQYSNRVAFSWSLGALFEHIGLWLSVVVVRLFVVISFLFALALPVLVPLQMFAPWIPFGQAEGPLFLVGSFASALTFSQMIFSFVLFFVLSFLFAAVWIGGVAVGLEIRDRGVSSFARFWQTAIAYAWRGWVLFWILTFVMALTAPFFVVPAIYLWMRLQFAPLVLVDLNCSWSQAIVASWRITQNHVGSLLITNLLFLLIGMTLWSTLWLLFFAYPLVVLVRTYLYRDQVFACQVLEEVETVTVTFG